MQRFGIGTDLINKAKWLYQSPTAKIVEDSYRALYQLNGGLDRVAHRDHYSFSWLWNHYQWPSGAHTRSREYQTVLEQKKTFFYADDILRTLSNPLSSIPQVMSLLNTFSHFSGYKINWGKCAAMPLPLTTFKTSPLGMPMS